MHLVRSVGIIVRDHIPLEQGLRLRVLEVEDVMSDKSETIFH